MGSYSCCSSSNPLSKDILVLSKLLLLIGEESRLKLLCILRQGEHCVCELMPHTKLSQTLTSHHLKDLKKSQLVTSTKRGLRVYYKLTSYGQKITNILFAIPTIGGDQ